MTDRTPTESGRALAAAAARLLDRLNGEPLPEGVRAAAALRRATRNAFLLVEETRALAAAEAPPNENSRRRPFFAVSGEPEKDREDGAPIDLQAHRERVRLLTIAARRRA